MLKDGCESGSSGIEKVKSELTSPDRKGGGLLLCRLRIGLKRQKL